MIRLENIGKIYHMGTVDVEVLKGISLTIEKGEFVSIMGASGSGKSTLMNIIGCLDVPTSGRYTLSGENVGMLSDDRLADIRSNTIGFVFQTYNLLPRQTALENVQLPLMYTKTRGRRNKALEALERVGLSDRVRHRPTEMSGGQQQRVGIARALVKDPDILLADEPTGNLDTHSSEEILGIIRRLNQEGITVIVVTHDPDIAAFTKRTITLRDGQVVDDRLVSPENQRLDSVGEGLNR
ncbi:MAG: ABC transporter ATP-binding protein [Chloroflexi bacterium]|nr:ABC transporter ATP-binding protein [Chloroflexota bacterium]